ncbi:5-oxoprolinase subunit PxpB [Pseudorhodoferax sp.]|uniref:5-oxoprolinase subunit PxpB n=1 Tax=Pseudorhodoferax sp. TaxID=1993553 RepID=UPI001B5DAD3B|nr:5-oxoprolinase subunit PxpB [Inhella sp.]
MSETWHWLAEHALCLSLAPPPDVLTQRRLLAMAAQLRGTPGLVDAVPGLHNLTLMTDAARLPPADLEALARRAWRTARPARETLRERALRVRYGGAEGPDLADCAGRSGMDIEAFVAAHAGARYEVACLGFLPGFAYLLGLPEALQQPRRASPRLQVPAGSVAIGGAQTGLYPIESPGGWQLIGRCMQPLFDARLEPPCWLLPGDSVRFEPEDHA